MTAFRLDIKSLTVICLQNYDTQLATTCDSLPPVTLSQQTQWLSIVA